MCLGGSGKEGLCTKTKQAEQSLLLLRCFLMLQRVVEVSSARPASTTTHGCLEEHTTPVCHVVGNVGSWCGCRSCIEQERALEVSSSRRKERGRTRRRRSDDGERCLGPQGLLAGM